MRKQKKEIPKISFLKKSNAALEFDILTLSSLFSRNHQLDHPLDMPQRTDFFHILYITQGAGIILISVPTRTNLEIFYSSLWGRFMRLRSARRWMAF